MLFIFSTPVLIRHLWQLKTVVSLHWCLILGVPLKDMYLQWMNMFILLLITYDTTIKAIQNATKANFNQSFGFNEKIFWIV